MDATANAAPTSQTRGEGFPTGSASPKAIEVLKFEALRSALYHDGMETLFRRIDRLCAFATIMLGSAAVVGFANSVPTLGQMAGIAIAAIGAAQLVMGFESRSRDHRELRRAFYKLLAGIERGDDITVVRADLTLLYADEPPVSHRANRKAHNRAGRVIWGEDFNKA